MITIALSRMLALILVRIKAFHMISEVTAEDSKPLIVVSSVKTELELMCGTINVSF